MLHTDSSGPFSGTPADNYERYFVPAIGAPVADDLIAAAKLKPGERVLDVACGTGVVARMAQEKVGASGTVAGLDANPGMLATARTLQGAETIDWYESGMESMPLPDESFDVVLCQLGLQFVTDKEAAAREFHRVLSPGGRALINLPGPMPQPFVIMADALSRHFGPQPAGFARVVFSFSDEDELRAMMEEANFTSVKTSAQIRQLIVPPPREFFLQYLHSTPLAGMLGGAEPASINALADDVAAQWQDFVEKGAEDMRLDVRMVTVIADR